MSWASVLEDSTREQVEKTSRMPFIYPYVALMPDAHLGKGCAVGAVIPTLGAIMPAADGDDIGCGMLAVRTQWTADELPADRRTLREAIESDAASPPEHPTSRQIRVGVTKAPGQHGRGLRVRTGADHSATRHTWFMQSRTISDRGDLLGLGTLGTLGDLELHALRLVERTVAVALDGGVVDEHVGAATILGDEAEALLSVEPLNGAFCHGDISF